MPNQSLITVPTDVTKPNQLRWFLTRLVEELDRVLGLRGDTEYVKTSDLAELSTIADLANAVSAITEDIATVTTDLADTDEAVEDNRISIEALQALNASTVLSSTYHDFDDVAYATLSGRSEFNTLGSNLSNAPYVPVGGETYYNYFNMLVTDNGGVVQELKAFSTTTLAPTSYFRIGNTWTEASTLGWT